MNRHKQLPVPSGRMNRAFRLGKLATGVAGGAIRLGARQWLSGAGPGAAELLLSPANAQRIAGQLSEMRGAAMKIGQLLSMEAEDYLPAEASQILSSLRENAHAMSPLQLESVLSGAWGADWYGRFEYFNRTPFAAASIGQVHEAIDRDGRRLAIKVQFPGIADSIDSDIDNVARILKLARLVPPGIDLERLLDIARSQLHQETDYCSEAQNLEHYGELLAQNEVLFVPQVVADLSGRNILAMTFVEGASIDTLIRTEPELRNDLLGRLIDLTLREFLHWGFVQSDPNFANFRFNPDDQRIGLLDFGSSQRFAQASCRAFARLIEAVLGGNLQNIIAAASRVGYLQASDCFNYRMAIADLLQTAAEPVLHDGVYDFGESDLARRLADKLLYLRKRDYVQSLPPGEVLFLHRKLAGIYMLCARLNARIDVRARVLAAIEEA